MKSREEIERARREAQRETWISRLVIAAIVVAVLVIAAWAVAENSGTDASGPDPGDQTCVVGQPCP